MSKLEYQTYLLRHRNNQNKGEYGSDTEKTKTYKSEWSFQDKCKTIKEFSNISEAQKYAEKVCNSKTWLKLIEERNRKFSDVRVVQKQRSTGRGTAGWASGNKITLDQIAGLDEYTLLHEMAHCLGNWHHGRSFRRDLLKLVSRFMGTEPAKMLKTEFKKYKLACGEPRKPLSYDQWMAAKKRALHALDSK